jgi:hypothetical protein
MANSDKNILITPATNTSGDPRIVYTPNTAANVITQRLTDSGTISFEGSAGQLFSINNSLTGTLFSVNDVSGIPSIDVTDTGLVRISPYNGTLAIGSLAPIQISSVDSEVSITASSAAQVPLAIRGAASQSGSVLVLQNSAGSITANFTAPVNNVNRLNLGGTDLSATLGITVHAAAGVGQVIRGAASQSANLLEIQSSAGTILSRFSSSGQFVSDQQTYIGSGATSISNSRLNVATGSSSVIGQVIRGAASQSANLQEWQDSSAGVHSGILSSGFLFVGGSSSAGGQIGITSEAATNRGMVIKGAASQTADLVQYQNSSSTILGGINGANQIFTGSTTPILTATGGTIQSIAVGANPLVTMASAHGFAVGDLVTLAGTTGGTYNGTFVVASTPLTTTFTITTALTAGQAGTGGTASDPAQLSVTARSAGTIGAIIRGAASQSADLMQWQDSAGARQGFVASGGNTITFPGVYATYNMTATAGISSVVPMVVTGASGQSVNLQEWKNNTPTTVASVSQTGAITTSSSVTTGAALNLNYASPTIASNNASAASIFTSTVTGITIGSSTIKTTAFPADGTTSTATAGTGYMGMPQNSTTSGAYTVVAADAGKHLYSANTRTVTINSNANLALPVGTTVTFISGPGATTTIAITTDTMYLAGPGTTGSRTLAPFGMATAVKTGTTSWFISGNGLT